MGKTLLSRSFGAPRNARRALSFCALAITALAASACGDSNLLAPATVENIVRTYSVYALTGSPGVLPAAYSYVAESIERPQVLSNGAVNFDVAFDLTADGKVELLPVRLIVPAPPLGAPTVSVQRSAIPFASLSRAPDKGYAADSMIVAGVGETVLLQLQGSRCIYGEPYYAKVTVDSVIMAERRMVLSSLVNRNCGYRALTVGIPEN